LKKWLVITTRLARILRKHWPWQLPASLSQYASKHSLVEKIHKNLGNITHFSLLSVQHNDSFPYRYCICLLLLYLLHHTWWMSTGATQHFRGAMWQHLYEQYFSWVFFTRIWISCVLMMILDYVGAHQYHFIIVYPSVHVALKDVIEETLTRRIDEHRMSFQMTVCIQHTVHRNINN
jgi:hypothetical protein